MNANGTHAKDQPLLQAEHLSRHFGHFTAVDDVTFHVNPGEVVGLLGANGAGKTTVIRMLIGLLPPTAGRALLIGSSPNRKGRRRLGYVSQSMGLYPDLTAAQNLQFSAQAYEVQTTQLPETLKPMRNELVGNLSLGLQRQLAFVIALQHSPDVLVLDEPTSGVSSLSRAHLWETIRDQADQGTGVLVTTHYMSETDECDRLLLMFEGRLVAEGSKSNIIGDTTATEVHTTNWAAAFQALSQAGVAVTLAGRGVRVANADPSTTTEVLERAGIRATVTEVPATIEEKMAALASAGSSAS